MKDRTVDNRVWSISHQPACPVPEHLDDTPEECLFDEEEA